MNIDTVLADNKSSHLSFVGRRSVFLELQVQYSDQSYHNISL